MSPSYFQAMDDLADERKRIKEENARLKEMVENLNADMVNHPPHYKDKVSGIECIEMTKHFNFCLGNAIKYIWRADMKGGDEDLEKAIWYLQRELLQRRGVIQENK